MPFTNIYISVNFALHGYSGVNHITYLSEVPQVAKKVLQLAAGAICVHK